MRRTDPRLISVLVWVLALTLFGFAQYRKTITAGAAPRAVDAPASPISGR